MVLPSVCAAYPSPQPHEENQHWSVPVTGRGLGRLESHFYRTLLSCLRANSTAVQRDRATAKPESRLLNNWRCWGNRRTHRLSGPARQMERRPLVCILGVHVSALLQALADCFQIAVSCGLVQIVRHDYELYLALFETLARFAKPPCGKWLSTGLSTRCGTGC